MSALTATQQTGMTEFLRTLPPNVVTGLAKIVSKNLLQTETIDDDIHVILLHSTSVENILSRKIITKDYLFRYLHSNQIAAGESLSKQSLIEKIVHFLQKNVQQLIKQNEIINEMATQNATNTKSENESDVVSQTIATFPIGQMAEQFSKWFFDTYNSNELSEKDFWTDCTASIKIQDTSQSSNEAFHRTECVADTVTILQSLKDQYRFSFNPNLTANGVQGRMDHYGLVYVANCGTIHCDHRFIGVYECAFGLLRDPQSDNNWKVKHLKMKLRSNVLQSIQMNSPCLDDCDSLREILAIESQSN